MNIENKKQIVINKRLELNEQIKIFNKLLKNEDDLHIKFEHMVIVSELSQERQKINFIINHFDYIKNYF